MKKRRSQQVKIYDDILKLVDKNGGISEENTDYNLKDILFLERNGYLFSEEGLPTVYKMSKKGSDFLSRGGFNAQEKNIFFSKLNLRLPLLSIIIALVSLGISLCNLNKNDNEINNLNKTIFQFQEEISDLKKRNAHSINKMQYLDSLLREKLITKHNVSLKNK